MRETPRPDYFKSVFTVQVEDTVFFKKDAGIKDLENRTNIAGIGITPKKLEEDVFEVETRSNPIRSAILDYDFIKSSLKSHFGEVTKAVFLGRTVKRRKDAWKPYDINELRGS